MNFAFRTDASIDIGTGHVMRCLTLADALAREGATCYFLCRDLPGNLAPIVQERGHHVHLLPKSEDPVDNMTTAHSAWLTVTQAQDAIQSEGILKDLSPDWLIVDHYALDSEWETSVRTSCARLMVVDDLADRPHVCEILLDQNLGRDASDYDGLVPSGCIRLIGPRYALLRPEFAARREESLARRRDSRFERILVTMGGVDKGNVTGRVLDALAGMELPEEVRIDVIMGTNSPHFEKVRADAKKMPVPTRILHDVADMAAAMLQADPAIGAAGTTSWERCCLGLPCLVVEIADNQLGIASALSDSGAALDLGASKASDFAQKLHDALIDAIDPTRLSDLSKNAAAICDGEGVRRVAMSLSGAKNVGKSDEV